MSSVARQDEGFLNSLRLVNKHSEPARASSSHPVGILIHIASKSVFTCRRNRYSDAPECAGCTVCHSGPPVRSCVRAGLRRPPPSAPRRFTWTRKPARAAAVWIVDSALRGGSPLWTSNFKALSVGSRPTLLMAFRQIVFLTRGSLAASASDAGTTVASSSELSLD